MQATRPSIHRAPFPAAKVRILQTTSGAIIYTLNKLLLCVYSYKKLIMYQFQVEQFPGEGTGST